MSSVTSFGLGTAFESVRPELHIAKAKKKNTQATPKTPVAKKKYQILTRTPITSTGAAKLTGSA
jgi:hypothetical protein